MEVIILYWLFSTLYCIGISIYNSNVTIWSVIGNMLLGWFILPTSLGTQRGKSLEE